MSSAGFVHLHVHSAYSLLKGSIKIAKLGELAKGDRQPALAVEPQAENVGDRTDVHRRRSHRHDEIDQIELPGCGNERQQSDRTAKTARAGQKDSPRAEPENGIADEYDQRGGEQVIGGGGAGDQRCRPTEATLQLREVDAMAVEAKSPAEHGNHEADRGDAPAVIA